MNRKRICGNYLRFFAGAVAVLTAVFVLGCAGEKADVIKIGMGSPLTGDQAKIGQDMKNGAQLAVDDINQKGGVLGKNLVLVAHDDKHEPREAVAIAQKLKTDKKVMAIVGHLNSACSLPASNIYHQAGIVMISPSTTNVTFTKRGYRNVFRVCTNDAVQGQTSGKFVYERLKKRRIATLHDKTAYGQGLAKEFVKGVKDFGGDVILFEGITQGDKDYTAILTKVRSLNPDILYFGGMYPEGGKLAKQMSELGMKIPLIGGDGLFDSEFLRIAGRHAEGCMASFLVAPKEKMPSVADFEKAYREKFGEMGPYSPYAYDAVYIIAEAIKRANVLDRKKIAEEVAKTSYNGVVGLTMFDEFGDTLNKEIFFYIVKDGKFVFFE